MQLSEKRDVRENSVRALALRRSVADFLGPVQARPGFPVSAVSPGDQEIDGRKAAHRLLKLGQP